ncbi:hypothetical protein [Labedaea rhizosphaerae]|uniref:Uncharacterized protein n=1 Tax=Labedaea rhizosphaerae TaxID=598644 RepID=A0A4R6SDG8_LABRH|nr:hypothetical protein [Labedaea rhizosphaerae]TDP97990.1 hypothetical protein EV186_103970 [Labedaea rhizosphaerae]
MSRTTTRVAKVAKVTAATVTAAAFVIAPLVTTGTALADGDPDPGTTQTTQLPPPPPKDDPDGHIWID